MIGIGKRATPDKLYTATYIKRFIRRCKEVGGKWATFSDLYGVRFPDIDHEWYERGPGMVIEEESYKLLEDFDRELAGYDKIGFCHYPGRSTGCTGGYREKLS